MVVALLYPAVTDSDSPDERDILVQAEAVGRALSALGHDPIDLPCSLDLSALRGELAQLKPQLVFNLVESLEGRGCLIHLVPFLLDALKVPYTGCGAEAILATSNKALAKDRLAALGLPTPAWLAPRPGGLPPVSPPAADETGGQWIVKSVWEHASIGLDESATVVYDGAAQAAARLQELAPRFGGACFAEQYIDGREFNLSLLGGGASPIVLRPAEIRFEGYPEDALRIVGYRAKWDEGSFEYGHTQRRFDFPRRDAELLDRLQGLALRCWQVFALRGYARVDFRVDSSGRAWILEVNTNPCLSPDAGFAASLAATGIGFNEAVARILAAACEGTE
jgi:D-alanine-D-alanine ligase